MPKQPKAPKRKPGKRVKDSSQMALSSIENVEQVSIGSRRAVMDAAPAKKRGPYKKAAT